MYVSPAIPFSVLKSTYKGMSLFLKAGGSYGTVFAWDLRRPQQAILLSGTDTGEATPCISESEVWEVQYDTFMSASNRASISSERVLPAMICSEDGILAVIKQGTEDDRSFTLFFICLVFLLAFCFGVGNCENIP